MAVLPIELRNKLERTTIEAREVAEAGAKAALEALAVHHHEPYGHMSPEQRKLYSKLRGYGTGGEGGHMHHGHGRHGHGGH